MVTAFGSLVRMKGLEPPRLAATDPKSVVSTNFTTSAEKEIKDSNAMQGNNIL